MLDPAQFRAAFQRSMAWFLRAMSGGCGDRRQDCAPLVRQRQRDHRHAGRRARSWPHRNPHGDRLDQHRMADQRPSMAGPAPVGKVERLRETAGKTTFETAYYLSARLDARTLQRSRPLEVWWQVACSSFLDLEYYYEFCHMVHVYFSSESAMTGQPRAGSATPGRNDPCPCGSGRKFKLCCAAAELQGPNEAAPSVLRAAPAIVAQGAARRQGSGPRPARRGGPGPRGCRTAPAIIVSRSACGSAPARDSPDAEREPAPRRQVVKRRTASAACSPAA